jgi:hypothetical protein
VYKTGIPAYLPIVNSSSLNSPQFNLQIYFFYPSHHLFILALWAMAGNYHHCHQPHCSSAATSSPYIGKFPELNDHCWVVNLYYPAREGYLSYNTVGED